MPVTARIAVTENDINTIVHVKATFPEVRLGRGIIEGHVYMRSVKVSIKGEYKVRVLPTLQEVQSVVKDGETTFETGDFEGYRAFSLIKR